MDTQPTGPVNKLGAPLQPQPPANELGAALPAAQPQQQAPDPTQVAQAAQIAHDSQFGRMAKAIMGMDNQYSVGPDGTLQNNPVQEKPGSFFRKLLGASLLGGAAGAAGNPAQGFAGGLVRGGAAGVQQAQQQDQQKQQQAQQDFKDNQQVQSQNREQTLMNAQLQQFHSEQVARQHTSDLQDAEQHDKHNAASAALTKTLTDAGGTPAVIPVNGKAASEFSANDLAQAYIKDPSILKAPTGYMRAFVDTTDSSGLTYNGHQWIDDSGQPVNMTDKTTVKAIDVPIDAMKSKVPTTGQQINAAVGYKLVDADKTYPMAPSDMVALSAKRMADAKAQAAIDIDKHRAASEDYANSLKLREIKDKEAGTGLNADGTPNDLATAVAHGHLSPTRMDYLLSKNPELLQGVMKVDPDFDSSKTAAYAAAYKDFTSSKAGSGGGTLNAAATAFKHLQELQQLNTLESRIKGTPDYQAYQNKLDTVAPELAKVYNDSTIPGIESYRKTLGALTYRDSAIRTQAQSMGDKVDSLEQTWKNAAPSKAYEAAFPQLDDKAKAARAALDPKYKARLAKENPENGLPEGNGQKIDANTAATFLKQAGGDPNKARQLAQQHKWVF